MSFAFDEAWKNRGIYFPMKDTDHMTKKHWFFRFLEVICHLTINIRIEVHFLILHWEMKGHWSRVNLKEELRASQDLHMTSVLSFPNANKKKINFNP